MEAVTLLEHSVDSAVQASHAFLRELLPPDGRREFDIRLWDGTTWKADGPSKFAVILNHPGALRGMFASFDEATLGEAYVRGDFDIEGSLEDVGPVVDALLARPRRLADKLRLLRRRLALPADVRPRTNGIRPARLDRALHSKERDREAIRYHYDVSNEFYQAWLDERMVYSCAYFTREDEDLDVAQARKLDYVCRKLRLRPGDRLLDIGCGWGALVMHAASRFGVEACGITLSRLQFELASERVRRSGLAGRCDVKLMDYRDVDEESVYDKVVSIGMFEHVGGNLLAEYFARAWQALRPGGVMLNHGVSTGLGTQPRPGPLFADRFGFPDAEIVSIDETLRAARTAGFEVRDVESLREHYRLTLQHWVRRMAERKRLAVAATDDSTFRAWQLVLAGGAHAFARGRFNVYQVLLQKPGGDSLPLTRDDWYRS